MNLSQIGRFISQRRASLGLTQAQLAQRLDVTDKAVSKWERGKSLPDVALLSRVAAELRVSVVELLSGEPMNVARSRQPGRGRRLGEGSCPGYAPHFAAESPGGPVGIALPVWQQPGAHPLLPLYRLIRPNGPQSEVRQGSPLPRGLRDGMVPLGGTGCVFPGRTLHPPRGWLSHETNHGMQFGQRFQSPPGGNLSAWASMVSPSPKVSRICSEWW